MKILFALAALFLSVFPILAQTIRPDLHNANAWHIINRRVLNLSDNDRKSVLFDQNEEDGFMILKTMTFPAARLNLM
jgi:hypothetical protein